MNKNETEKKEDNGEEKSKSHFEWLHDFRRSLWQDFKETIPKVKTWLEIAALGVVVTYTFVSCNQWKTAKRQLAEQQKQTRLSIRPWMGIEDSAVPILISPIQFDEKGNASMQVQIRAKNYTTNAAAQNVATIPELWIVDNLLTVENAEKDTCAERRITGKDRGRVIFPGNSRSIVETTVQFPRNKMNGERLTAWLIGCIHYEDQFGFPYHTSFRYRLNKPDDIYHAVRINPTPNTEVKGVFLDYGGSVD
jgi:hypothetical protein